MTVDSVVYLAVMCDGCRVSNTIVDLNLAVICDGCRVSSGLLTCCEM